MIDGAEIKTAIEGAMGEQRLNQREIAHAIFGRVRGHKRISLVLGELVAAGKLEQFGSGQTGDPFTYARRTGPSAQ
ncbi:MAG: hypothetical protein U1E53_31740 [Dongiaceae bacterium]